MDKASRSRVLLDALAKVPTDDALTAEKLLGLLLAQPADDAAQASARRLRRRSTRTSSPPLVLRGAYAALMIGDGKPDDAWQIALKHEGHLVELLLGVRYLPASAGGSGPDLRGLLFAPIAALLKTADDPVTRAAALDALGWTRRDAATFEILAREVKPAPMSRARPRPSRRCSGFPRAPGRRPRSNRSRGPS